MMMMIVEDNYQMRRLIKSIVGDLAVAGFECGDGSEALAFSGKWRTVQD